MLSNALLNRAYLLLLYAGLGIGGSAFSVLTAGAAGFCLIKTVAGRLRWRPNPVLTSMALAGLAYYVSGLLMVLFNPLDSASRVLLLERLWFFGFVPLFLQIALSEPSQIRRGLEYGGLVGGVAVGFWAIWEWTIYDAAIGDFRVSGAPGNPGPFGTSCGVLMAICLNAARSRTGQQQLLFVVAALLAAFGLILSGMRTLYPLLVLVPLIVAGLTAAGTAPRAMRRWRWAMLAALVSIVPLGGIILMLRLSQLLDMATATGLSASADNSLGQRIALWQCAADAFGQAPILGLGRSGAYAFMQQCTGELVGEALIYSHFHNALATAAAFGGAVEIAATAALLLVPLYWCWRYRADPDARYAVVLILSVLTIYALNGLANLMLGHDIHDALFVHLMTVALVLLVRPSGTGGRAPGDAAAADRQGAAG